MEQKRRNPILFLSVSVAALFLLGFLLLVTFGAKSYCDVVDSQYGSMDRRALTSYIAASIKANDCSGMVSVEDSAFGQVLVITDAKLAYALRYYYFGGQLVEDIARVGSPLSPEEAQYIAPTERFSVEFDADGLLCVTTDAGKTLISLRSREEALP